MLLVMAMYPRTHRTELIVRWIDAYDLSGCGLGDEAPNFWGRFAPANEMRVHLSRVCEALKKILRKSMVRVTGFELATPTSERTSINYNKNI